MARFTPNLNGNTVADIREDLIATNLALFKAREALGQLRANVCHSRNYFDQQGRRDDLYEINTLAAKIEAFQKVWIEGAARICNEADQ